jgi:hypothetical protein
MATAEQVTQELQLLRAQTIEMVTRIQNLEENKQDLIIEVSRLGGQLAELNNRSNKEKDPKNLTMSKELSNITTYDGRAEEFEHWLLKMRNWLESEDKDFVIILKDIEDEDDDINNEWMDNYAPGSMDGDKVTWMNQQLYHILAQKTTNSPLQTIKNLGDEAKYRGAAAWSKIVRTGKGRNANRALVLTGKVHNPKRVEKYQEVLPAFESWESYVK